MSPSDEKNFAIVFKHIGRINQFMEGHTLMDFQDDLLLEQAVNLSLAMIGEYSSKISIECKAEHPEIPWREMSDFRNRIVHDYDRMDFEIVFDVIRTYLPQLEQNLRHHLPMSENLKMMLKANEDSDRNPGKRLKR